jgi:hypothetical protein
MLKEAEKTFKRSMGYFAIIVLLVLFLVPYGCGGGGGGGSNGGSESPTLTADAGPDQNVDELTPVSLDGSQSSGNPASFLWEQVLGGGDPVVTINNPDSAICTFTAPVVSGQTPLTFRLTVADGDGASDSDEVTVVVENTALLSGSVSVSAAGSVDLTNAGLIDWAHWGRDSNSDFNQKAGVTNQISDATKVNNPGGPFRFDDAPVAFSWTDGTPDPTATNTTTGVYFSMPNAGADLGKGYSLTIDADSSPKTLTLHAGGLQAEGVVVATLSDGSAGPFVATIGNENGTFTNVVTLTFMALSDTATLNIEYTLSNDFGTASNLTLLAAELDAVAKPTISPPNGSFTDSVQVTLESATPGAEIRYTDNNTEPIASSTLYIAPFTVTNSAIIRAKAFLNGSESPESSAALTVSANSGGSLSAFVISPTASVDLTTEGSSDWAHWGRDTNSDFNQKAGVTNQISNATKVNNPGGPFRFDDAPVAYSWTDGTSDPTATDTTTGVFFSMPNDDGSDIDKGYSLTVDADTNAKRLRLYLGGLQAEGRLVASLGDSSAEDVILFIGNELGAFTRCVTIDFRAASSPETLTVEFTLNDDFGTPSNLTLQAATLN